MRCGFRLRLRKLRLIRTGKTVINDEVCRCSEPNCAGRLTSTDVSLSCCPLQKVSKCLTRPSTRSFDMVSRDVSCKSTEHRSSAKSLSSNEILQDDIRGIGKSRTQISSFLEISYHIFPFARICHPPVIRKQQ